VEGSESRQNHSTHDTMDHLDELPTIERIHTKPDTHREVRKITAQRLRESLSYKKPLPEAGTRCAASLLERSTGAFSANIQMPQATLCDVAPNPQKAMGKASD
jgi:hypothetical protein